jgi:hypothetical protein
MQYASASARTRMIAYSALAIQLNSATVAKCKNAVV